MPRASRSPSGCRTAESRVLARPDRRARTAALQGPGHAHQPRHGVVNRTGPTMNRPAWVCAAVDDCPVMNPQDAPTYLRLTSRSSTHAQMRQYVASNFGYPLVRPGICPTARLETIVMTPSPHVP